VWCVRPGWARNSDRRFITRPWFPAHPQALALAAASGRLQQLHLCVLRLPLCWSSQRVWTRAMDEFAPETVSLLSFQGCHAAMYDAQVPTNCFPPWARALPCI